VVKSLFKAEFIIINTNFLIIVAERQ